MGESILEMVSVKKQKLATFSGSGHGELKLKICLSPVAEEELRVERELSNVDISLLVLASSRFSNVLFYRATEGPLVLDMWSLCSHSACKAISPPPPAYIRRLLPFTQVDVDPSARTKACD